MPSYKIFLTKSNEAASAIAHGFGYDMSRDVNGITGVSCGTVGKKEIIPAVYHNKGYFYCAVEHENLDGSETPRYELIIC